MSSIKLTVFFEDPFWVGVFEREDNTNYEVAKITFVTEPSGEEIYQLILKKYNDIKFTKPLSIQKSWVKKVNPKRLQRKINKEVTTQGIGTKAQQALKLDIERRKVERKVIARQKKEEIKQKKYLQKQLKKKEKKKGH